MRAHTIMYLEKAAKGNGHTSQIAGLLFHESTADYSEQLDKRIAGIEEYIKLYPKDKEAVRILVYVLKTGIAKLVQNEQYEEALYLMNGLLEYDPDDTETKANRTKLLRLMDRSDQGVRE